MFSLVQKRRWFFLLSGVIIMPGVVIMLISVLTTGTLFPLSNDFVGGSIYELRFSEPGATESAIREVFTRHQQSDITIQRLGAEDEHRWSVRAGFQEPAIVEEIITDLRAIAPLDTDSLRIEQVSETVGSEVTRAALLAVLMSTVVVAGFIVIAFRSVPKAVRYGVCAIIAMFHDVLIVAGMMSLAGLVLGWEVDALFLTAVLTVVGFSVQDTIVMFDRIRENIPKHLGEPYEAIVNRSILETIHRSFATQLNAFFIMIAILLFGGESIKQFIAMLFIGLVTGTYSSVFIAVPLLVAWEKGEIPLISRKHLVAAAVSENTG